MNEIKYRKHIKDNTIRLDASHTGGGNEINVEELIGIEGAKMTAYQNYLGGGMLGAIGSDINFIPKTKKQTKIVEEITEILKRYFHNITNDNDDEWADETFEQNQSKPKSAY